MRRPASGSSSSSAPASPPASAGPEPTTLDIDPQLTLQFQLEQVEEEEEKEEHIPRPPNSFILFRRDCCLRNKAQAGPDDAPQSQKVLSRTYSELWKAASPAVRAHYKRKAAEALAAHKAKYPHYKYRPGPPKRKNGVRVAPPAPPKKRARRKKDVGEEAFTPAPAKKRTRRKKDVVEEAFTPLPPAAAAAVAAVVMVPSTTTEVGWEQSNQGIQGSSTDVPRGQYPDHELQTTFHDQGCQAPEVSEEVRAAVHTCLRVDSTELTIHPLPPGPAVPSGEAVQSRPAGHDVRLPARSCQARDLQPKRPAVRIHHLVSPKWLPGAAGRAGGYPGPGHRWHARLRRDTMAPVDTARLACG